MKRILLFCTLLLSAALLACGGSSGSNSIGGGTSGGNGGGNAGGGGATSSVAFAFMQEVPSQVFVYTPMIGKFTGTNNAFTSSPVNDPSTGQPFEQMLNSVALSIDGKKAVFEMGAQIYTANADGSNVHAITAGLDYDPQFSPDGNLIVYTHEASGPEIWVMNADGSNQHVALNSSGRESYWPNFSNDGAQIVAVVNEAIAITNVDGTGFKQLTDPLHADPNYLQWDEFPAFTKSGKIAFSRWTEDSNGMMTPITTVFTMNADGSNMTLLVPYGNAPSQGQLAFDPLPLSNGKIVFVSNRGNPGTSNMDLYAINEDGTGLTRLTNNTLFDAFCSYLYKSTGWVQSPSGTAPRSHDSLLRPK